MGGGGVAIGGLTQSGECHRDQQQSHDGVHDDGHGLAPQGADVALRDLQSRGELLLQARAGRTGLESVKSVTQALVQAERYGTPVAQALRVLAACLIISGLVLMKVAS